MTPGTIVVLLIIAAIVGAIIFNGVRKRAAGKNPSCSGCSGCSEGCSMGMDETSPCSHSSDSLDQFLKQ